MGGKSAPQPTPDYGAAAKEQGLANAATSKEDWIRTLGTQSDPYKTTSTVADPNSASGYTTKTTFDPADQARLDQQRKLMSQMLGVGDSTVQQVQNSLGKAFDTSSLDPLTGHVDAEKMGRAGIKGGTTMNTDINLEGLQSLNDPTAVRQKMMDESYKNFSSRFDPVAERQQEQMRARIANMGGVTTSDASRQQMSDLLQGQNDARTAATFEAQKAGQDAAAQIEAQQLANRGQQYGERTGEFGLENQAVMDALGQRNTAAQQDINNAFTNANLGNATRAQGLSEMQQIRQMPMNELLAMLSGTQVQGGTFGQQQGSNTTAAPIFGAAQATGAANQAANATAASERNSMMSALGSVAGMGATAMI